MWNSLSINQWTPTFCHSLGLINIRRLMAYRNVFRRLWWKHSFPQLRKLKRIKFENWRRNLGLNASQQLIPRKRKMCRRSSLLFSLTFHPSASPKELTSPCISLLTPLIHSFNSFPADSLVSKLTRQQFARLLREHWLGREGTCGLHHRRRRNGDPLFVILQLPMAFPGAQWSGKLRQAACGQEHGFVLCYCIGP